MTEAELLGTITSNGWTIQRTEIEDPNPDLTRKAVLCWKAEDSVVNQKWFHYFVAGDVAYWQTSNPFPPAPAMTFSEEVQSKISGLVASSTIKAGYVEKSDNASETALAVVVKNDDSMVLYHIYKDAEETIQVTPLTGTYPV